VRAYSNGRIAFLLGLAAVLVAALTYFAGGFAVAPALCTIAIAASARRRSGWHRGRLVISVGALIAACALFVWALASYGRLPE
jgi:di/tricarboxylate transporter